MAVEPPHQILGPHSLQALFHLLGDLPLDPEVLHQLSHHVFRVGGAAPVAAGEQLAPCLHPGAQKLSCRPDLCLLSCQDRIPFQQCFNVTHSLLPPVWFMLLPKRPKG